MFVTEIECSSSTCGNIVEAPAFTPDYCFCSYSCAINSGYYTVKDGLTGGATIGQRKLAQETQEK